MGTEGTQEEAAGEGGEEAGSWRCALGSQGAGACRAALSRGGEDGDALSSGPSCTEKEGGEGRAGHGLCIQELVRDWEKRGVRSQPQGGGQAWGLPVPAQRNHSLTLQGRGGPLLGFLESVQTSPVRCAWLLLAFLRAEEDPRGSGG